MKPCRPLAERFWERVDQRSPEECWPWTASKNNKGYGQISKGGRTGQHLLAHRVAYELFVGPVPPGLELDHVRARGCVRTDCVNPAHLEPVTHRENIRRGYAAKPNCPAGHAYAPENTYLTPRGHRRCRACHREEARKKRSLA